jgi:hypothetical protein
MVVICRLTLVQAEDEVDRVKQRNVLTQRNHQAEGKCCYRLAFITD